MVQQSSQSDSLQVGSVQHLNIPSAAAITQAIREVYGVASGPIPLHAPVFEGRERDYVLETIESTFVSSVGAFVDRFESMLQEQTGARHAIAMVNGTTALQLALLVAGVKPGEFVITQSLSFAATSNAIAHASGMPIFIDVEESTLGMSPDALREFLAASCERVSGGCRFKATGDRVAACVPMHTFGMPCRIEEIADICTEWGIALVEDAAEAQGSWHRGRHCGTTGLVGTLSFNGNKTITTGGGGAILTNDAEIARHAKHLSTTAKRPHRWQFYHDEIGYNFRMPNINAALGCAQLERLSTFLAFKRDLASRYRDRFA
jgi:perosamine synthetase